jgi:AcrR family transcriptional regulator
MRKARPPRADAVRTLAAVLEAGARLLAKDPSVSIAAIAAEAGVDRRTVYRHFPSRQALVEAVIAARFDSIERAVREARLDTAPIVVALHRLTAGLITTIRHYPFEPRLKIGDKLHQRAINHDRQLATFMHRAVHEGVLRADLPQGLAVVLLREVVNLLARRFVNLDPNQAADLGVDVLLSGLGHNSH